MAQSVPPNHDVKSGMAEPRVPGSWQGILDGLIWFRGVLIWGRKWRRLGFQEHLHGLRNRNEDIDNDDNENNKIIMVKNVIRMITILTITK